MFVIKGLFLYWCICSFDVIKDVMNDVLNDDINVWFFIWLCVSVGELVQLSGRLLTSEFQENFEEPDLDYFTRILVGGMFCNHMSENGEL